MTYAEELLFVMPVIAIAMAAMGTIVGTGVLCCPGENQVQRPMTKFHNFVIHTRLMVVTLLLMLLVLWINLIVVEGVKAVVAVVVADVGDGGVVLFERSDLEAP